MVAVAKRFLMAGAVLALTFGTAEAHGIHGGSVAMLQVAWEPYHPQVAWEPYHPQVAWEPYHPQVAWEPHHPQVAWEPYHPQVL